MQGAYLNRVITLNRDIMQGGMSPLNRVVTLNRVHITYARWYVSLNRVVTLNRARIVCLIKWSPIFTECSYSMAGSINTGVSNKVLIQTQLMATTLPDTYQTSTRHLYTQETQGCRLFIEL